MSTSTFQNALSEIMKSLCGSDHEIADHLRFLGRRGYRRDPDNCPIRDHVVLGLWAVLGSELAAGLAVVVDDDSQSGWVVVYRKDEVLARWQLTNDQRTFIATFDHGFHLGLVGTPTSLAELAAEAGKGSQSCERELVPA